MTKLKILLAVLVILLVFLLGYGHGQAGEVELPQPIVAGTGDVLTGKAFTNMATVDTGEQIIYTWEMTFNGLVDKVDTLVGNYDISYSIVEECTTQAFDSYKHCIESVIGVSNAESSIFKNGMYPSNNGFGLMYKGKKRRFSSVQEGIKTWVSLYVKNGRATRKTGQDRLKGNYCASGCSNWTKAYSSAIKKLDLD